MISHMQKLVAQVLGLITSERVPWMKKLDNGQVEKYSREAFIDQDGWIAKLPY